ncbi:MAG: DUF1080 domain-containing protein [Gemmatimonadaceae bacterium]|nr:DUF1080 domain-containing protein [Gemmatimonadaceae bacterium]
MPRLQAARATRPGSTMRHATTVTALLLVLMPGCASKKRSSGSDADAIRGAIGGMRGQSVAPQAAAPSANPAPWVNLFADGSLAGWHNYATPGQPVAGWTVENGELVRSGRGGDITSDKIYANFEMELEWKVGPGGNSGVIYRIDHSGERSYTSGPEMQILDDAVHADGKNPLTSAGANYALHAAPRGVVKPAGEWNAARLVVSGNHVEHWLNGSKVVEYELGSADWDERRRNSKFANAAQYGRAARGNIALQDHGDRVYFRNVRIRELP